MKHYRGISIILILATLLQLFTGMIAVAQEEAKVQISDGNYPIWYLRENFGSASSWDKARAWNGTNTNSGSGVNGVELTDSSTTQKSEAYRALNDVTSGVVTLDFDFRVDRYCDNVAFRLLNDQETVFGIVTKGTNLYLEQPGNTTEYISNYNISVINKDKVNYVVAHLDMDNKMILDVYIDGVKCIENKPFASNADKINGFDVETDEAGKVVLTNQRIYLYKGFIVRDDFYNNQQINPIGWEFVKNGGTLSVYTANNRNADRYSLQMNTSQGNIKAVKKFNAETGHLIFETSLLQQKSRNGIAVSVNNGNQSVLKVTADGEKFYYHTINTSSAFYDYLDNVWYVIKFDMDLSNQTADVYLNNKLKAENVALDSRFIDNITIDAAKNDSAVVVDDVKLYHPQEYAEDYVEAPQKPEKVDDSFLIGMQMCPLWTEGLYTTAWDYIKTAPDRMPILGAYDEGNPEVNDWEIKWLIDHGFDFQWVCTYPSYQMSYAKNAVASPTKPDMVREGNALYEGFMNAKYSEDFKFAICMENSFLGQGTALRDYFYDVVAPYWIEYYFKDDRYLKIDGRPVMSVLVMDSFLNMFEGTDGLTGAASIKAGVDKFRQMCIDAGVGNPYITDQPTQNGYSGKAYTYYSQCGIDGTAAYGYNQKMTLGQQKQVLEKGLAAGKTVGVETVPCLAPRRGDDPWLNGTNETGFKSTEEELDHTLEWVKDTFGSASQTKLSKQLVMLATWDEYGEGHCLCPSEGDGFKYLDCVRKVMCKEYEHEEAIPTETQKERVNKLVVQDRKPGFLSDAKMVGQILENSTPEIPTTVKQVWNFTDSAAEQEWIVESGIGENSITSEGWVLQPTNTTPAITIGKKIAYDISDVTYIKVRMKQSKYSTGGYAYWITSTLGEYDTKNIACHMPASVDGANEFRDYYIPVGEKIRWKGNLTGLKINLGVLTDISDNFVVESISFLSDDKLTNMAKVSMDGANYVLNPEPVVKNGVAMVPLREITTILGINVENYARTKGYLILGQNTVLVHEGSLSAKKGNSVFALQEAPYKVSDIVNDTLYVPINVIAEAIGKKVAYDAVNNVVNVESTKQKTVTVNRKILGELSGGDAEAFYDLAGVSKMTYEKGITIMQAGGYATPLSRSFAGIDMSEVKVIAFKFTSSSAGSMKFLYSSQEDPAITGDKASRSIPVSAGENYIEEPTTSLFQWEGTFNIFRFQPPASKTLEIEWIRFLGDPLPEKEGVVDASSCMTFTDEFCSWEFNENTEYDGWLQNKYVGSLKADSGILSFKVAGQKPSLISARDLNADASKVKSIDIAMKNETAGKKLKLYFTTDKSKAFSEDKSFEIAISSNDQYDKTYSIDVSKSSFWNGTIKKLMLVTEGRKGSYSFDYVKLNYITE